jgi:shikimate kinase
MTQVLRGYVSDLNKRDRTTKVAMLQLDVADIAGYYALGNKRMMRTYAYYDRTYWLERQRQTTVGQLLAQAIGWQYLDTDQLIEQTTQRTIADIFAHEGEVTFRQLEAQALQAALQQPSTVIATGGGIVEAAANRELLRHKAFIVWLHAPTNALVSRLSTADDRPLLAGDAALALERMATRRTAFYAELAHWNVATQHLTPTQATDEIIRAWTLLGTSHNEQELYVTTPGGSYAVRAGSGVLAELPGWLDRLQIRGRAWLISDTAVLSAHGEHVITALRKHGREVQSYAFPNGEQHKTLETVRLVYDWLLASGVERGDVVLALGGGVVGDLAGFVAATVLRGIALVQLPTTVLAMVDSAIGGKTGVDHAVGKT